MNANDKVANLLEKKETLGKKRDELILQVMEVDRKIEDICSEIIDFQVADLEVGKTITFGEHEGEPIEWIAIDQKEGATLLLSKGIVSYQPFEMNWEYNINPCLEWKNCEIRKWLNNEFIYDAFSDAERKFVQVTEVQNYTLWDPVGAIETRESTHDYLFLLSIEEMEDWYDDERTKDPLEEEWYLRTPILFDGEEYVSFACDKSASYNMGDEYLRVGVRPAFWLKNK